MQKQILHSVKQSSSLFSSSLKIIICFALVPVISCKKEDGKTNDPFVTCCTYDATTFKDGDRSYAIPTLITNNMDGLNDGFQIFYSPIAVNDTIVSLRIFDDSSVLVFESTLRAINSSSYLWDGIITSGPEKGERYRGAFSYECIIKSPTKPNATIIGKACMVSEACDARDNITNCVFGTQHNGAGEFDRNLPSIEYCE